jgi:hypothetical protein
MNYGHGVVVVFHHLEMEPLFIFRHQLELIPYYKVKKLLVLTVLYEVMVHFGCGEITQAVN